MKVETMKSMYCGLIIIVEGQLRVESLDIEAFQVISFTRSLLRLHF